MKDGLITRRGVGVNKARLGQPRGQIIALEISPMLFARCDCSRAASYGERRERERQEGV
jgi:hypothetical protein